MATKKKKKSGGGSKGNGATNEGTSNSNKNAKQKRSTSASSLSAAAADDDVGGDGLAAQLPEGFIIKRMPADGNCLFSAVDDQVAALLESDPGALSTRR